MALFVTGETAPFLAEFFDVFIRVCGSSASLGTLVLIIVVVRPGPVSSCVHGVWVWKWHFDSQNSGPLLWRKAGGVWFLLGECGLLWGVFKYPFDVLDRHVVLMVLSSSVGPPLEIVGPDDLEDVIHHVERQFRHEESER